MFALTLATAKNIAIGIVAGLVVISLITAKVVANVTKKIIVVVVLVGLAVLVWTQRQSLQSCADKVRAGSGEATCSFFGTDVTINAPLPDAPTGG
jgi:threonine/homoserine/homoserine lactone efflux protein